MSKQMNIAVDLINNLRHNLNNLDASEIKDKPELVFLTALRQRMESLGFSKTGIDIDDVVTNFNTNISDNTEKEVAEYLGVSFAEILYDILKKLGEDFEFWPFIIKNLSVEF